MAHPPANDTTKPINNLSRRDGAWPGGCVKSELTSEVDTEAAPRERENLNLKVRDRGIEINLSNWVMGTEMGNSLEYHTYHNHIELSPKTRKIE
jgi:hypothetical protein